MKKFLFIFISIICAFIGAFIAFLLYPILINATAFLDSTEGVAHFFAEMGNELVSEFLSGPISWIISIVPTLIISLVLCYKVFPHRPRSEYRILATIFLLLSALSLMIIIITQNGYVSVSILSSVFFPVLLSFLCYAIIIITTSKDNRNEFTEKKFKDHLKIVDGNKKINKLYFNSKFYKNHESEYYFSNFFQNDLQDFIMFLAKNKCIQLNFLEFIESSGDNFKINIFHNNTTKEKVKINIIDGGYFTIELRNNISELPNRTGILFSLEQVPETSKVDDFTITHIQYLLLLYLENHKSNDIKYNFDIILT